MAKRRSPAAVDGREPQAGDDAGVAVTRLLELHGAKIRGLALRLCGNAADADDVVQEVFLQALRKWHTFRGEAQAGTWLYTIALRVCRRRLRRAGRAPRPMSQLMPWGERTVAAIAAAESDRGHAAERREAIELVKLAIAGLPEHLRVPVVLKEVMGVSVEEVASALGLSANTVKTRLHRGRLALRKAMTAGISRVAAPAPMYDRQVCLDLFKAKMTAMDRGGRQAGFVVPQAELCARCRAVFRELDLVQDACARMREGRMPQALRRKIQRAIEDRDKAEQGAPKRRGRRPVRG